MLLLFLKRNIGIGYDAPASVIHIEKPVIGHLLYLKNALNSGSSGKGIAIFAGQNGVATGAELITFYSPDQTTLVQLPKRVPVL